MSYGMGKEAYSAKTGMVDKLLVRREKEARNYPASIHLACAQLIFSEMAVCGYRLSVWLPIGMRTI
jgi:hypothetical protein